MSRGSLLMFDSKSEAEFLAELPESTQRLIGHISKREPWSENPTINEALSLIDDIGAQLKSHSKIMHLNKLDSAELSTLFVSLSIGRYLSSLAKLGGFAHYAPILQKIHNDINSMDHATGVNQAALIARLRTLVRFEVIGRIYSPERVKLIESLLQDGSENDD